MDAMAKESGWEINNGGVALMWRGGCIIRSAFLGKIKEAFDRNPKLAEPAARPVLHAARSTAAQAGWRRVGRRGRDPRHPAAGHDLGPGLLRRLPHRPAARRTCSRPSATTSAPTPTSGSTSPAASSSTPTGPAAAARPRRRPTTSEVQGRKERGGTSPPSDPLPFSSRASRFASDIDFEAPTAGLETRPGRPGYPLALETQPTFVARHSARPSAPRRVAVDQEPGGRNHRVLIRGRLPLFADPELRRSSAKSCKSLRGRQRWSWARRPADVVAAVERENGWVRPNVKNGLSG